MKRLMIRDILLLTVGALTLVITALVLHEMYAQWQRLELIESLKDASSLSDRLFDATSKLSVERDIAATMLHAPDAAAVSDLRQSLAESRRQTDEAMRVALQMLAAYAFPELAGLREKIKTQLENVHALRAQIDRETALPERHGAEALAARWTREVAALVRQTEDLWVGFVGHFTDIDPIVTQHLRLKQFLRIITDYMGQERALIGQLLVENASASPEEIAQLLRGQGAIGLSWESSRVLADNSGLYPAIAAYYTDAKSHYATLHDMMQNIFYVPGGAHAGAYPISADLWLELSNQAMESLDALKEATLGATQRYVEGLENQARREIAAHALLLLFVLCLCLYSLRIILRRVIQPVNAMVNALIDATEGRPVTFALPLGQQDEIGKLAQVLHAFQESGDRYRALVEASSQIIWTWKPGQPDGMKTLFAWWEKTTGQPGDKMLPFGWVDVLHPDDREEAKKIWEHASSTGDNYDMEYRLLRREGGYCWVYVRGVGIKHPDGTVRELVGALTDITARKQAEAKTALLASIVTSSEDAIISKTLEGDVLSWNIGATHLFGYTAAEMVGQHIGRIVPPERQEEEHHIIAQIREGKPVEHFESERLHKDGRRIPISLSVSPIRDEAGKIVGASKVARDITAKKEAEQEILRAMQALERSNKELDDFAYIASHDLKEPLRGIHNHSRFLLEDNEGKLDAGSVSKLHRLVYLSQRMERLVNDLLYFSRLGRQELAIQQTDVNAVIEDIENTLDVFLTERKARIVIPQALPTVTCDKPRVTELFRNLITNAVKYNDKPEKTVEIGFLEEQATPRGVQHHRVFYVKDDGKGIAPEFHEEVFRIFKRLQSSKDAAEEGTGVGLTFVKKIIERHGGSIWLASGPGQGTTFYFTLEGAQ